MESIGNSQYQRYSALIRERTGISLGEGKKQLLMTRVGRVLARKGLTSPEEYLLLLENPANKEELQDFIDAMTTNTTEFFRENHHFEFLRNQTDRWLAENPRVLANREIRIWSAGCSSGQEPVTLRILMEELFGKDIRCILLATDISRKVLRKAAHGFYTAGEVEGIPKAYLLRHFEAEADGFRLHPEILGDIRYRHFNLMEPFPFRKGFDLVFCRNVMIYFGHDVQQQLVTKFYNVLQPGGLFFIGHSESLINKHHHFHHLGPSLYQR